MYGAVMQIHRLWATCWRCCWEGFALGAQCFILIDDIGCVALIKETGQHLTHILIFGFEMCDTFVVFFTIGAQMMNLGLGVGRGSASKT